MEGLLPAEPSLVLLDVGVQASTSCSISLSIPPSMGREVFW